MKEKGAVLGFSIYRHFKIWLLLFLIADTIVVIINGAQEGAGDAPPITLLVVSGFMLYIPVLVKSFIKENIPASISVIKIVSLYSLGIILVSLTREAVATELPRAMVTAVSIWGALVLGTCIGSSEKMLKIFTSTLLFFGVTVCFVSITTGVGVISNISSMEVGRSNRLWTIAFGVIDPICIFGSGFYLLSRYYNEWSVKNKVKYLIFTISAVGLVFYSSTRSYLIQLIILLGFGLMSGTSKSLRSVIVPTAVCATALLIFIITQAADLSNIQLLSQFGFVDGSGSVSLEKSRTILHNYLIEQSIAHPLLGVGMNEIKQSALILDDAAKTEYGYYLHIAAFGYLVSLPFYLIVLFGGFLRPLLCLAQLPIPAIRRSFVIHGIAVGCFLAGFNGYYAQATSVAQFIALVFIGVSIQLDAVPGRTYIIEAADEHKNAILES